MTSTRKLWTTLIALLVISFGVLLLVGRDIAFKMPPVPERVVSTSGETIYTRGDIERVCAIWRDCLDTYGGPYLFGGSLTMADAMYAPVCTRFFTYDVKLDSACAGYCKTILDWPAMIEWTEAARLEPEELEELDVEF